MREQATITWRNEELKKAYETALARRRQEHPAVVLVAVETQSAPGCEPTLRSMARLAAGCLDRHEALHAVGNVLTHHILGAMKVGAQEFVEALYAIEL